MARIRYLKPDFFKDEDIKELPYEARLFFAGLWCFSDREGRGEDRPERLKVEIFPYDDVDIEAMMALLAKPKKHSKKPFINRYVTDNNRYYEILEWDKHQKPHHTERHSVIPNNGYLTVKEPLVNSNLQDAPLYNKGNGEGNGEGKVVSPKSYFYLTYEKKFKKPYLPHAGKDLEVFERLKSILKDDEIRRLIDKFFKSDDEFILNSDYSVQVFGGVVNRLNKEPAKRKIPV